jgi:hypothetical protein
MEHSSMLVRGPKRLRDSSVSESPTEEILMRWHCGGVEMSEGV